MTYKSASKRAQRALLAIGAGLTLAVAAAPVAEATPAKAASTDGACVANANGVVNSDGAAAGSSTTTCTGKPAGGGTGHKVG
jgi:hypothetical protein